MARLFDEARFLASFGSQRLTDRDPVVGGSSPEQEALLADSVGLALIVVYLGALRQSVMAGRDIGLDSAAVELDRLLSGHA